MMQVVENQKLTTENFVYWLQGFCEIHGGTPTDEQWKVIKEHLELLFIKMVTTTVSDPNQEFNMQKMYEPGGLLDRGQQLPIGGTYIC